MGNYSHFCPSGFFLPKLATEFSTNENIVRYLKLIIAYCNFTYFYSFFFSWYHGRLDRLGAEERLRTSLPNNIGNLLATYNLT